MPAGHDIAHDLLDAIVRQLARSSGMAGASVHLVDRDGLIEVRHGINLPLPLTLVREILETGLPLQRAGTELHRTEIVVFAGLPVCLSNGTIMGVVSVFDARAQELDEPEWESLELAARQLRTECELAALRRQRDLFPTITDSLPGLFYILDENVRLLRWNRRLEELAGIEGKALAGIDPFELFAPEDRPIVEAQRLRTLECGQAECEARVKTADGRTLPYYFTGRRVAINGRDCIIGMGLDLSARQAAIEASEARYRSLVESARDAIVVVLPDGCIESINGAFSEMVGFEAVEWVGRNLTELVYEPDLPRALQALSELSNEERMPVFEVRVKAKDGIPVPVEVQGTQIRLADGTLGALVIARDVRERKAMDSKLQRIQRLDAIGQLAAGVAHDFNNLLQIIHGEIDLLLTHPLVTPPMREALQNVGEASTRAQRITRKLLLLSREHDWQAASIDLNEVIARFLPMLARLLGAKQQIDWQPAPGLPMIRGDLGMLEQVLMNLLINARDAMPDGGRVRLATREVDIDAERAARDPDARAGRHIELAVCDDGSGIAPEHLPHIFEPLFTTKAAGEGTGLGLATIYGIVRRHEGWIDVQSALGRGTQFLLYFPVPATAA